jgi:hypothetical protein
VGREGQSQGGRGSETIKARPFPRTQKYFCAKVTT